MAYDESLAARIRDALRPRGDVAEKKMFGGVAFLLGGRMFCGVVGDELMVRVGPERHADALAEAHVRPMDFSGRPMNGYVYVGHAGCRSVAAVARWVERGVAFVATLDRAAGPTTRASRASARRAAAGAASGTAKRRSTARSARR